MNPLVALSGTLASYNNCFQANVSEIPPGEPYWFGLKHLVELHQNIVNLVLDFLPGRVFDTSLADHQKYIATNWEVYIGNSPIWHKNPKCQIDL